TGAAQFLTLQNRFDNALKFGRIDSFRVDQRLNHLPDGPFLVEGCHIRANRVAADKVGKLHSPISFRITNMSGHFPSHRPGKSSRFVRDSFDLSEKPQWIPSG